MNKQELDFTDWYFILMDELKQVGIHGAVDHDTARNDYDLGMSPYESAKLFAKTMTDDEED